MDLKTFKEYCLSLKGSTEKYPWTEPEYASLAVFEIADKWYALFDTSKFEFCNLKCDPAKALELQSKYKGIVPAWHMNKKYWISVYFDKDVPDEVIKELTKTSYDLVFSKLPKKTQEQILNS